MNHHFARALFCLLAFSAFGCSQTSANPRDPHSVPAIDGGAGTCSADFTVTDADNKPVYAAKIKVHIAYGFMYVRKLDLEISTNIDGKARFTGLPDRTKRGLFFEASEGDRKGTAFDDSSNTCQIQLPVILRKALPSP